jgi:glycosyltransferase involved in cell wall biosynthesis
MRDAYGLRPRSGLAEQAKRALYARLYRRAAGLVGWSTWTKQSYVDDYGCREENVAVIPPGVDPNRFSPGERNHELPRLLFVGGDFARKGGDLLLEIFRNRLRGRAELHLVTRSDEVKSEQGVRVYRNVAANSDELRHLYATSDVFVVPTRADCFSLVCLEAMASSLPIVATRVGGISDLIHEGKNGYAVPVNDPDVLGDALESLIADPAGRQAMGAYGRDLVLRQFDARESARRLFEFVRERCGTQS